MKKIEISPFKESDIKEAVSFLNVSFGDDFYKESDLESIIHKFYYKDLTASFCARIEGEIVGVRLTYAPGKWTQGHRALTPQKWKVDEDKVAYFKTLSVSDKFQKMGIGKSLSNKAIEVLKEMGTEAIICHSWLESPGNSSQIYLERMGFEAVKEHPNFWYEIEYDCNRCGVGAKCVCTASEMIKYLG